MAPIFALLFGASIGLHLEESVDVSGETVTRAIGAVASAIHVRTGTTAAIDDFDWESCNAADRCLGDVRARLGVEEVVMIRVFGGPQSVHLVLEVLPRAASARVTLPSADTEAWPRLITEAMAELFPRASLRPAIAAEELPRAVNPLPWVLIGSGAIAVAVGIGFGASSRSIERELETMPHDQLEYDALSSRQSARATLANVFFGAAAAAVIGSVIAFLVD